MAYGPLCRIGITRTRRNACRTVFTNLKRSATTTVESPPLHRGAIDGNGHYQGALHPAAEVGSIHLNETVLQFAGGDHLIALLYGGQYLAGIGRARVGFDIGNLGHQHLPRHLTPPLGLMRLR